MLRYPHEHILLIGDSQREMEGALRQAVPSATLTMAPSYFDGIAELVAHDYTAVVAAAEPIERRPEAAVRTLRELAGQQGRVILFGYPALEAISRKMLEFGCDDYLITPANQAELQQMFGAPLLRIAPAKGVEEHDAETAAPETEPAPASPDLLGDLPLAEILLDGLLQHPTASLSASVQQINLRIAPRMHLIYHSRTRQPAVAPAAREEMTLVSTLVRFAQEEAGHLHLFVPPDQQAAGQRFLGHFAQLAARVHALQDQHKRLQKLAITDELTGVFNRRYFKHFLSTIIERAHARYFWVTLLLFDIDNFKKYNDQYGHSLGDEILRETATVMKRCVREHDLVARIGGDEFAVVFWDKEGPRQPKDPAKALPPGPPQEPQQIFDRFKKLIASRDFPGLGPNGQGVLTISGGLANYPWDGSDMDKLITVADYKLMFKAKKEGKNSIVLVGTETPPPPEIA